MLYDPSKKQPTDAVGWTLWQAADYIERHGWLQHKMRDHRTGAACAAGAIFEAVDGNIVRMDPPMLRLSSHVHAVVEVWNDTPGRTKEEVVAVLRSAALCATEHDEP